MEEHCKISIPPRKKQPLACDFLLGQSRSRRHNCKAPSQASTLPHCIPDFKMQSDSEVARHVTSVVNKQNDKIKRHMCTHTQSKIWALK